MSYGLYAATFAPALLLLHFFERLPRGWDQAEYSWAVSAGYLPHSPYILYFLVGLLFAQVTDPPSALSAVSVVSGSISIALLTFVARRLPAAFGGNHDENLPATLAPISVALVYGLSPSFVRGAATQEVYAMQTAFLLAAIALPLTRFRHRVAVAGAMFGCALGTHNGSVFVAPALAFLLWSLRGPHRARSFGVWAGAAVAIYGVVALFVAVVLPNDPGQWHLLQVIRYLRGVAPGFRWETLASPTGLAESFAGLTSRLLALDGIPSWRSAAEGSRVALGTARLVAVAAGLLVLARQTPRVAIFWLLVPAPFLFYELLLGESVDPGTYLPFVLPTLAIFTGGSVALVVNWGRHSRWIAHPLALVWLGLLLLPSVDRLAADWDEPTRAPVSHFTPEVLAAAWIADHLPPNAVVVGPRLPQNPNVVPYYSHRRPLILPDRLPVLMRDPRPFTPMNLGSYEPVTTDRLARLIDEGIPVFAFEDQPIVRREGDTPFDPDAFRWVPVANADLRTTAQALRIPASVRARLALDPVVIYRGERAGQAGIHQ